MNPRNWSVVWCMQVSITFSGCTSDGPVSEDEARAVGATCAFLYAAFTTLPMSRVITGLAYSAQLVPQLWPYMKRCHIFQSWPPMELVGRSATETQLSNELLGWMLPLCIFSPVYRLALLKSLHWNVCLFDRVASSSPGSSLNIFHNWRHITHASSIRGSFLTFLSILHLYQTLRRNNAEMSEY